MVAAVAFVSGTHDDMIADAQKVGGFNLGSAGQEFTLDGIRWVVVTRETPDDEERSNRPNLARHMRQSKIVASIVAHRPKGKGLYMFYEYAHPRTGAAIYRKLG